MKRKNTSRNALVTSVLSLLMCVSMLVGTTFAWFTDEVVSGMNTIAAGNLDVDLLVDGTPVTANTPLFSGVEKWEPGVVVYENFQVANIGTLALKYQMTINFGNENDLNGHKLSEVLKIVYADRAAYMGDPNYVDVPVNGLISKESPVGQAVMGRRVGDRVQVEVNPTMKYFVEIRAIEKGEDDESLEISAY